MGRGLGYITVAAAMLLVLAGANIPAPLYDEYRQAWGLSPLAVSAVFAIYPLSLVVTLWAFGRISDRFGRRPVIVGSLFACAAGSLLFAVASGIAYLFAARFAQAVSVGLLSGSASAALVELQAHNDRRRASLIATAMLATGTAVGPLASGLLAQYLPLPLLLPYGVHLAVLIPITVLALRLPETAPSIAARPSWLPRIPRLPASTRLAFAIASVTSGLSWLTAAPFISLLPSYLRATLGVHNLAFVGAVAFLMLGSSTLAQFVVRKAHEQILLRWALALAVAGYACVILAASAHMLWLIVPAAIISGIGHACGTQGGLAAVNRIAPEATRGEMLSLHYSILYLIVGVPMLGVGLIATLHGFFTAFAALWITMIVIATILALATIFERRYSFAMSVR